MNQPSPPLNESLHELLAEVQAELKRRQDMTPSRAPGLEKELAEVERQKQGWAQSLGNPSLPSAARSAIEDSLSEAVGREHDLRAQLEQERALERGTAITATPDDMIAALDRLETCLANDNVTLANVELALHIDTITCDQEGRVLVRTCRLGALHGALDLLRDEKPPADAPSGDPTNRQRPRNRRLTRRDVRASEQMSMREIAEVTTDRRRFDGLPESWFWTDELRIPEKVAWTIERAQEVLQHKEQHQCSTTVLMEVFGKSRPTILTALRMALKQRDAENGRNLTNIPLPPDDGG